MHIYSLEEPLSPGARLQNLSVTGDAAINLAALRGYIGNHRVEINTLTLDIRNTFGEAIRFIEDLPSLRCLRLVILEGDSLNASRIVVLCMAVPQVRELVVDGVYSITLEGRTLVEPFGICSDLGTLDHAILARNLVSLSLCEVVYYVHRDCIHISCGVDLLENATSLKVLEVSKVTQITLPGSTLSLKPGVNLPQQLERLSVEEGSPDAVMALVAMIHPRSQLAELRLPGTDLTAVGLADLLKQQRFKNVEVISLLHLTHCGGGGGGAAEKVLTSIRTIKICSGCAELGAFHYIAELVGCKNPLIRPPSFELALDASDTAVALSLRGLADADVDRAAAMFHRMVIVPMAPDEFDASK